MEGATRVGKRTLRRGFVAGRWRAEASGWLRVRQRRVMAVGAGFGFIWQIKLHSLWAAKVAFVHSHTCRHTWMKLQSRICAHFLCFFTSISPHLEQYVYSRVTTQKYTSTSSSSSSFLIVTLPCGSCSETHTPVPPESFTAFAVHEGQQPLSATQIQATRGAVSILQFVYRKCPELAFRDKMETVVKTVSNSQVCCCLSTGVL